MTFRIASIVGAGCLRWQPWLVIGAFGASWEDFPLSGGVHNGVEVTIAVDGILESDAKIEFLTRDRKIAFSFEVNRTARIITRSAAAEFNVIPLSFGGWPSGLEVGPATFVFTKRRFEVSVDINGKRYPWFDFANVKQVDVYPMLTHVSIFSGLTNAEVRLELLACQRSCHPAECLDESGNSVCEGVNGTTEGCVSVVAGAQRGVALKCTSQMQLLPKGNAHCCDGHAVTPPPRGLVADGKFAVLSSSQEYLKEVCSAFGTSPCPSSYAGAKVEIQSSDDVHYSVFVPKALSTRTKKEDNHTLPMSTIFTIPSFALMDSFGVQKVSATVPKYNKDSVFNADSYHDVIINVNDAINAAGIRKGWYMHLVNLSRPYYPRLVKFSRIANAYLGVTGGPVWVSDEPVVLPDCVDLKFNDTMGNNCSVYEQLGWCSEHGYSTERGCAAWGLEAGCDLPGGEDLEVNLTLGGQDAAALQCCACGGGRHVAPGWGASAASTPHMTCK